MIVYMKLGGVILETTVRSMQKLNYKSTELFDLAVRLTADSRYLREEHPCEINWEQHPDHFHVDLEHRIREARMFEVSDRWTNSLALEKYLPFEGSGKLSADAHLHYNLLLATWTLQVVKEENLKSLQLPYLELYRYCAQQTLDAWKSKARLNQAEALSNAFRQYRLFDTQLDKRGVAALLKEMNQLSSRDL